MNEVAIRARMQQSREARSIGREKFGAMLGYTAQSIKNYEKGDRGIPYADLPRWADITGVPVSWLLFGEQALEVMDAVDALHKRLDVLRTDLGLKPDRPATEVAEGLPPLVSELDGGDGRSGRDDQPARAEDRADQTPPRRASKRRRGNN